MKGPRLLNSFEVSITKVSTKQQFKHEISITVVDVCLGLNLFLVSKHKRGHKRTRQN